jgi:hypothetical protein
MAEHLTRNEDVGGSTPPGGSRLEFVALIILKHERRNEYQHKGGDHLFLYPL